MPNRTNELALKRGRLQERISVQRATLTVHVRPLVAALEKADDLVALGQRGVDYARSHPLHVGLAFLVLGVLQPRRMWRWGQRAYLGWATWQKLRGVFARMKPDAVPGRPFQDR